MQRRTAHRSGTRRALGVVHMGSSCQCRLARECTPRAAVRPDTVCENDLSDCVSARLGAAGRLVRDMTTLVVSGRKPADIG
ncbi:hypothetical protein GCM10007242_49240 [Pigmentiphaga litoralis]|nr:hypothetical protein GCM10007242_49240 [Pigmentiphaga litoralis]